ncbi:MAG: type II secretion system F family protein [Candidatus Hadarchaeales archaeon]
MASLAAWKGELRVGPKTYLPCLAGGLVFSLLSFLDPRFCLGTLVCFLPLPLHLLRMKLREAELRNQLSASANKFLIYLALSLRLSPNFERAVTLAVEHSDEELSRELAPYLRKAILGRTTFEKALREFSKKWGLKRFERAVELMRCSVEAGEERKKMLEEVIDRVLEETKAELLSFSTWLYTPSLILYSIGILLPLALLPALPVLSALGLSLGTAGVIGFLGASLLLTHLLAQFLLSKHPLPPKEEPLPAEHRLLPLCLTLGFPCIWLRGETLVWFLLWNPTLFLSLFLWLASRKSFRRREEALEMEKELPDLLRRIGTGMLRGKPVEEMLGNLSGGELSRILRRGSTNLRLGNMGLYWSLFDPTKGVLAEICSERVRENLHLAVSVAERSTLEAGQALVKLSEHLRDLEKVEAEGKRLLSGITASMRSLSLLFGPAILSVTSRMLFLLQRGGSGLLAFSLNPSLLLLALGIYCLGLVWVCSVFCCRLENGRNQAIEHHLLAQALPASLLVFTIFSLFGKQLVNTLLA